MVYHYHVFWDVWTVVPWGMCPCVGKVWGKEARSFGAFDRRARAAMATRAARRAVSVSASTSVSSVSVTSSSPASIVDASRSRWWLTASTRRARRGAASSARGRAREDARDGATAATTTTTTVDPPRAFRASSFEIDEEGARAALGRWLRARATRPRAVRGARGRESDGPTFRAVYAPYWVFDVSAETQCEGAVEVEGNWVRSGTAARAARFDGSRTASQICASFAHRRDFVDAMRPGAHVDFESKDGVMTAEDELRARTPSGVTIEPFDMRRSMAAALAAARMRAAVRDEAREALLAKITNGTSTRDIVVEFNTLKRRAHAVYHPMWCVEFAHGSVVDATTNKIIQQPREAIVCGVTGEVVSDELVCEDKARGLAFSAVALPAALAAYAWPESALLFLGQGAVASAAAAASAAVLARQLPKMQRDKMDAARVVDEERAFARATRSVGNTEWMDEGVQRRRDDAEWRRWKETDKLRWVPANRRAWAYSILEAQVFRFRERQEARHEMEERAARADEAARREAANRSRRAARADERRGAPTGRHPGFSRDAHGFYKILRLETKLADATSEEIKRAFRLVALETHPDKVVGDAAAKTRAAERFRRAQKAYATLGDKEKRVAYDRM